MSIMDFIKKHEKLLQRDDPGKAALASLKRRLEELQAFKPDYQQVANRIYHELKERDFPPEVAGNKVLKLGDKVIGVGEYGGKEIDGLKGKVVEISRDKHYYGVEWEKNIGGHNCRGRAKVGYGWRTPSGNLRRIFQKPNIGSRKDYDEFLNKLKDESLDESLDHDDKDFKLGDEVELQCNIKDSWGETFARAGERGTIAGPCAQVYHVLINGKEHHVDPQDMAKVRKIEKNQKFKVRDEVEIVNVPTHSLIHEGSRGKISRVSGEEIDVEFHYLNGREVADPKQESYWIQSEYLRRISKDMKPVMEVIKSVEEEFALPEYENRRLKLNNEISDLLEREIISIDDLNEYPGILEIADEEEDQELEGLLK